MPASAAKVPFDYESADEPLSAHASPTAGVRFFDQDAKHPEELAAQKAKNQARLSGSLIAVLGGIAVVLSSAMFLGSARNLLQVGPGERWMAFAGIALIAVGGLVVVALGMLIRAISDRD